MAEHVKHKPLDQTREVFSLKQNCSFVRNGSLIPKPPVNESTVDRDALATLIYSGTVLAPKTIFQDFVSIGMGGDLDVQDGIFSYSEPQDIFPECDRNEAEFDPINLLAEVIERNGVDSSRCQLMLSEGKDSTAIAIAFAELGKKIDCVTFANDDTNLELINATASRFGHRLRVIRYRDLRYTSETLRRLSNVFEPNVDQALLSYMLLPFEEFRDSVLIDGMGNDIYMGHLPSREQFRATQASNVAGKLLPKRIRNAFKGRAFPESSFCGIPFRTFTECQGLYNGFEKGLVERSTQGNVLMPDQLDRDWKCMGFERARALSRGRYLDTYSYSGKSIALAEMASATIYFPWADHELATRYSRLPDDVKFAWPSLNKILLRESINKRFAYSQPKIGFRAPIHEILAANRDILQAAVDRSTLLGEPLKLSVNFNSGHIHRTVACVLIALWEMACES